MTTRIEANTAAITTHIRSAYLTTVADATGLAERLAADGDAGFTYKVQGLGRGRVVAVYETGCEEQFMGGFLGYVARPLPVAN